MRMIRFEYCPENEDWCEDMTIPAKWAVCERCGGEGHHGNTAFDGLSLSWFHEQGDEFVEDYFTGRHDVECEECGGNGLVLVVDEDRADKDVLDKYNQFEYQEAENRLEDMYWARMENRGYE